MHHLKWYAAKVSHMLDDRHWSKTREGIASAAFLIGDNNRVRLAGLYRLGLNDSANEERSIKYKHITSAA
jgi:hypothetical protein